LGSSTKKTEKKTIERVPTKTLRDVGEGGGVSHGEPHKPGRGKGRQFFLRRTKDHGVGGKRKLQVNTLKVRKGGKPNVGKNRMGQREFLENYENSPAL